MTTIETDVLSQSLDAVLDRVAAGEWFEVALHGRPIARLCPIREPGVHVGSRFGEPTAITPLDDRTSDWKLAGHAGRRSPRRRSLTA